MCNIWRMIPLLCYIFQVASSSELTQVVDIEERDVTLDSGLLVKMFSGYDKNVRPNFDYGPTIIIVDLYVESFGNIKEADMEYTMFGYFRQSWVDRRFAGRFNHSVVLKNSAVENAWIPDTYCTNARQSNLMMIGPDTDSAIIVDTDGSVFYTKRVTLVASCEMKLQDFPLDHQKCFVKFGSYGYKNSDIVYRWQKENVIIERKTIAQFRCRESQLAEETAVYSMGNYSELAVSFTFHRSVGYYVMQVYAPDVLVVAISWTLFWMDKHDMNTRMAVGVTTILTIVFLLGSANASLPRVSYAKAIDWYIMVSFAFIFAALFECMLVFHFRVDAKKGKEKYKRSKKKAKCISDRLVATIKSRMRRGSYSIEDEESLGDTPSPGGGRGGFCINSLEQHEWVIEIDNNTLKESRRASLSDKIDLTSRYLFPISFFLFNIFYWFAYVYDIRVLPEHARDI